MKGDTSVKPAVRRLYSSVIGVPGIDPRAATEKEPHQGRWCYGKTPMLALLDSIPLGKEQLLATFFGVEGGPL